MEMTEKRIRELEVRSVEIIYFEKLREGRWNRNQQSFQDLCDNYRFSFLSSESQKEEKNCEAEKYSKK